MQVCDASSIIYASIIYAWDNYPILQFPGLWEWLSIQIGQRDLVIPRVAFEEVSDKAPECGEWLKEYDIEQLEITNTVLQDAQRIKGLLGIVDDNYHPKGVGENDIFIIAIAREHGAELVSDEEKQTNLPNVAAKRKIPAVCAMTKVSVPCINFIGYIRRSQVVFR
jgi:hypothetical protein